ncbi:MAG: hypothetical protein L6R39_004755 [Caloplaca ligustica]|nr:MAG: hypothetical protein L6R39_004755 [Caloplaca ligustica]
MEETTDSTRLEVRKTAENMRRTKLRHEAFELINEELPHPFAGPTAPPRVGQESASPEPAAPESSTFTPATISDEQLVRAIKSARGKNYFAEALSPGKHDPTYLQTELGMLRQRLNRAENEILRREHTCRVCGWLFLTPSMKAEELVDQHYRSHAEPRRRPCPHEGCLEDLEDRALYPSYQIILQHISDHKEQLERCSKAHCHCPLDFLTDQQRYEHMNLHPVTSSARESPQKTPRDTATQTDRRTGGFREPKLPAHDSLSYLPQDNHQKIRCDKCQKILVDFDQEKLREHARACETSVRNFLHVSMRPDQPLYPAPTLRNKSKTTSTPRKVGKTRKQTERATAAAPETAEANNAPDSAQLATKQTTTQWKPRKVAAAAPEPSIVLPFMLLTPQPQQEPADQARKPHSSLLAKPQQEAAPHPLN